MIHKKGRFCRSAVRFVPEKNTSLLPSSAHAVALPFAQPSSLVVTFGLDCTRSASRSWPKGTPYI